MTHASELMLNNYLDIHKESSDDGDRDESEDVMRMGVKTKSCVALQALS